MANNIYAEVDEKQPGDPIVQLAFRLNIQILTFGDWVVFFKNDLDVYIENEPCISQNFILNKSSGHFLSRVWNVVALKGKIDHLNELESVLTSSFLKSSACKGSFSMVEKMQSKCGLLASGMNQLCDLCQPVKTEPDFDNDEYASDPDYDPICDLPSDILKQEAMEFDEVEGDNFTANNPSKKSVKKLMNNRQSTKPENGTNKKASVTGDETKKILDSKVDKPKIRTRSDSFTCELCDETYVNLKSYIRHMQKNHPLVKELHCQLCDVMHNVNDFLNSYQICRKRRVKQAKRGPGEFECDICFDTFKGLKCFVRHVLNVHPKVDKLTCKICNGNHETHTYFDSYRQCEKLKREIPSVACDKCGRMFKDKDRLKDHYNVHTQEKEYKCKDCPMTTFNVNTYMSHVKVHKRERGEVVHSCEHCGKTFCSGTTLRAHIRLQHDKIDDNIKCEICNIVFKRKSNWRGHVYVHHSTDPNFQCKTCGKRFPTKGGRIAHERIHEGLTAKIQEPCPLCGKEIAKDNMPAHIRTHTGEKPYKCKDCDYRCVSSTALSLHRRRHRVVKIEALTP